jgi:hypothetical protein
MSQQAGIAKKTCEFYDFYYVNKKESYAKRYSIIFDTELTKPSFIDQDFHYSTGPLVPPVFTVFSRDISFRRKPKLLP